MSVLFISIVIFVASYAYWRMVAKNKKNEEEIERLHKDVDNLRNKL